MTAGRLQYTPEAGVLRDAELGKPSSGEGQGGRTGTMPSPAPGPGRRCRAERRGAERAAGRSGAEPSRAAAAPERAESRALVARLRARPRRLTRNER